MIRLIIGATILTGCVWFTFSVKLGRKTFAEHIEAINKTREARDLVKGVRSMVRPAISEAKERVLGEYVEAPTSVHRTRTSSPSTSGLSTSGPRKHTIRGKAGHNQNQSENPSQNQRPTVAASCSSSSSPGCKGGQTAKIKKSDANRAKSSSPNTPLENPASSSAKVGESRGPKTRETAPG